MMTSLGLDLSATASGIVLLQETKTPHPKLLFATEIKPKAGIIGMERVQLIALSVMEIIHEHKPSKIVVEGYSLNMKNSSSVVPLVEIGGVVRLMLFLDGFTWLDPRATELKKFVTGKGNAPKEVIMMAVLKRWGYESPTNNIADGYGLACMGLAQSNRLPGATLDMRKIAGGMAVRTK